MINIHQTNSTSDTAAWLWARYEAIYDELEVLSEPFSVSIKPIRKR